jgi:hypothetical protein
MALYQTNVNAQLVALSAEGGQVQKMSRRATQLERRRTALELSR